VRGLVLGHHEVDDVGARGDEEDLEDGQVQLAGHPEGPEQVEVARRVHEEVEELRLERDARCALLVCQRDILRPSNATYAGAAHLVEQYGYG
jgi:hypothetical protein